MKRSKMIELLCNEIHMDDVTLHLWPSEANAILVTLEQAGMLPPSIPTNASGWEIGKGTPAYINEWDKE